MAEEEEKGVCTGRREGRGWVGREGGGGRGGGRNGGGGGGGEGRAGGGGKRRMWRGEVEGEAEVEVREVGEGGPRGKTWDLIQKKLIIGFWKERDTAWFQ
jgi:hypothetical protein